MSQRLLDDRQTRALVQQRVAERVPQAVDSLPWQKLNAGSVAAAVEKLAGELPWSPNLAQYTTGCMSAARQNPLLGDWHLASRDDGEVVPHAIGVTLGDRA
jgi:hypothetical protein